MAVITTNVDNAKKFTLVTIDGELIAGELYDYFISSDYKNRTDLLLWDYRKGRWSTLPTEKLLRGFAYSAEHSNNRQKTAYVFATEADFGVGRMFQNYAVTLNHKARIELFFDYQKAEAWLFDE